MLRTGEGYSILTTTSKAELNLSLSLSWQTQQACSTKTSLRNCIVAQRRKIDMTNEKAESATTRTVGSFFSSSFLSGGEQKHVIVNIKQFPSFYRQIYIYFRQLSLRCRSCLLFTLMFVRSLLLSSLSICLYVSVLFPWSSKL